MHFFISIQSFCPHSKGLSDLTARQSLFYIAFEHHSPYDSVESWCKGGFEGKKRHRDARWPLHIGIRQLFTRLHCLSSQLSHCTNFNPVQKVCATVHKLPARIPSLVSDSNSLPSHTCIVITSSTGKQRTLLKTFRVDHTHSRQCSCNSTGFPIFYLYSILETRKNSTCLLDTQFATFYSPCTLVCYTVPCDATGDGPGAYAFLHASCAHLPYASTMLAHFSTSPAP